MRPGDVRACVLGILIGFALLGFQRIFGYTAGWFAFGAFIVAVVLPGLIRPRRD
ncbi:hypothetical protein [Streptomyces sp. NPDC127040]|uniref:hypothetical protein n=1 Tax=Streptomyces sp. NPDC127040 TaxID=3347116 RepID=UPI003651CE27